jgi:hypothetical protein
VAAQVLQKRNAADIDEIGESGHRQKPEQQGIVFVLEDQNPIRLEVEQDADNGRDEIGDNIRMAESEQMLEDEKENIVDEQPERRVQHGDQHKADKLGLKISF